MKYKLFIAFIAILLFTFASEGPKSGGTFANDSSNSGVDTWTNLDSAGVSDNKYSKVTANDGLSSYLKATNFGFTSVSGTVNGIVVEVERKRVSGTGGDFVNAGTILVIGGTPSGDLKSEGYGSYWSTVEQYITYGSSSDLWGLTPSASDITGSGFGAGVAYEGETAGSIAWIDHIRITVTYTAAAPNGTIHRTFSETRSPGGAGYVRFIREVHVKYNFVFASNN